MQLQLLSPRLAILPSGRGGSSQDYNDTRLDLVGAVACILELPLSPEGRIDVVGKKSFQLFAFLILLIIIVPIALLFFPVV
jgi:hypothetical protein